MAFFETRFVDVSERNRVAALFAAAQLHAGDVDAVVAENGAHRADDAGHVFVLQDENIARRHRFQIKIIDAHDARVFGAEDRPFDFQVFRAVLGFNDDGAGEIADPLRLWTRRS